MNIHELTIQSAHDLLRKKEITSKQLTIAYLERIKQVDSHIGAYLTIDEDGAIAQAEHADEQIALGNATYLTGIPLSIKDIICTQGLRTTCGSRILENFIPPYNATVMGLLHQQHAVILGKVNLDEFAMGSSTENSAFHVTRNPWNTDYIPGGSSGGSAASVAADMCCASIGSDTGGSIRQPAAHCGVVGMKPTYGRVSRYGLVAYASSLDQIGPLTKTVMDTAIMLQAISGYDPKDATSAKAEVPDFVSLLTATAHQSLSDITIGLPVEYFQAEGLDKDVANSIQQVIDVVKSLGAKCIEISLPHTQYAIASYYVIAPSEASSNLARYDGVRFGYRNQAENHLINMYKSSRSKGFGSEVKRRIIIGTYALSSGYYDAYYKKASQVRTLIGQDFKNAFQQCHVILSPVTPTPAFAIGEKIEDPLTMYLTDIFTISANLSGIPGISVPCGVSSKGLPIGVQLMGNHFDEKNLLQVAYQIEKACSITHKKKKILS
ncbi:MAG: Asp-tRNA(Asn)/Glu-tRNA(Gln) amidotransferase subunit GatA [Desulfobacterales bacterium]|nr:Asp-tRNA(Asn)/Glu-tRNA(Gln) amidotransferase subunit GatA [Desulfobacterales bacterium]